MPDNATQGQRLQVGKETTQFTAVAATKKIRSFEIELDPQLETDTYYPSGFWVPSSNSLIQEWVEGAMSGVLTYTEIVYALEMLLGAGTISTPAGGTNSRKWRWEPAADALLSPTPFTVEKGSTVYGMRAPGVHLTDFNIGWSRTDRIEIGGSVRGGRLEKGTTMTVIGSNPTVPLIRALPTHVSAYADDTYAAMVGGTPTKMLRAFEAGISLGGLYGTVWPMNSALTGMDGIVPMQADSDASMLLMADANGMAFLDTVRADQIKYLKITALGPIIEAAIRYEFTMELCVQVKDVDSLSDHDGVWAVPWTFQPIADGSNPPIAFTVVTTLLAL